MADYEAADLDEVRQMLDSVLHHCGVGFPHPRAGTGRNHSELIGEMHRVRRALPRPRCLAPGGCADSAISSHALQRRGALRLLEREGHVYMLKLSPVPGAPPVPEARLVGTGVASTFPGLCARHDTELFRPIESGAIHTPTPEQLFLVSYRSMLCECYARRRRLAVLTATTHATEGNRGFSAEVRVFAEELSRLAAFNVAVVEGVMKPYFELVLANRAFSEAFGYLTFRLPALPFAGTAYWAPQFDLFGRPVQSLGLTDPWRWLSVSALPDDDGTLGVVSFAACHLSTFAGLLETLDSTMSRDPTKGMLDLLLRSAEQVALSPAWWESTPEEGRRAILARWWMAGNDQPIDSRPSGPLG